MVVNNNKPHTAIRFKKIVILSLSGLLLLLTVLGSLNSGQLQLAANDVTPPKTDTLKQQQKTEESFNPENIDYTLYVPTGTYGFGEINIMELPDDDPYTYFNVKIDGHNIATVHEGAIPSEHELCTNKKYACASIGTDKRGAVVQRQVSGHKNVMIHYSTTIGDTYVILSGVDKKLVNEDIMAIFNSLTVYKSTR